MKLAFKSTQKTNETASKNSFKNLKECVDKLHQDELKIKQGGGNEGKERQKRLGRLTARERLSEVLDEGSAFLELGLWAGYEMYEEFGPIPAAGVITGIGVVSKRHVMLVVNDAGVKAGAMFPQSVKKVLRAQRIAYSCRLPILYLVDSSGVFLPLQDEIFPDEDDFGRIFRNNAVLSAQGIPQFAAIMGNCIAGGGYLPVLADKLLMTEGSGLYLAGPALVKAAIGQIADTEELGGAKMHAEISGTVDFLEKDDKSCLKRLKRLVDHLPTDIKFEVNDGEAPSLPSEILSELISTDNKHPYDAHLLIETLIDGGSFDEYKKDFGKTLITGYAKLGGQSIGIVASQRQHASTGKGEVEIGGVIYAESADKAARFILDCNQTKTPILFIQDVSGFMVGKAAEQSGIIRSGAKLVNALSNSIVPKITLIAGNSFGAGNYALCGKAYDPAFIFAWPNADYAVMGADQAAETLLEVQCRAQERKGEPLSESQKKALKEQIAGRYRKSTDIRYGAARGWVDAIIDPFATRSILILAFEMARRAPLNPSGFHTGVIQL